MTALQPKFVFRRAHLREHIHARIWKAFYSDYMSKNSQKSQQLNKATNEEKLYGMKEKKLKNEK